MTDREKQLIVGVLTTVYTGTLNSSKSLEEQCEDFIALGQRVMGAESENSISKETNDLLYEAYVKRIEDSIPKQTF